MVRLKKTLMIYCIIVGLFNIIGCDFWITNHNQNSKEQHTYWPSLADSPWPMHAHDPQHTGRSPYAGPEYGEIDWNVDLGSEVDASSPVIGENNAIYVGVSRDFNGIYGYSAEGQQIMSLSLGGRLTTSPVLARDNIIYIGSTITSESADGIAAITTAGNVLWELNTPAKGKYNYPVPDITGDFLYLLTQNYILKIHAATGVIRDSLTVSERIVFRGMAPAFSNDGKTLYATGGFYGDSWSEGSAVLFAFDTSGTHLWTYDTNFRDDSFDMSYPSVDNQGTIYFQAPLGVHAVNPDGSLKWTFKTNDGTECFNGVSIGIDGTLYFTAIFSGIVYALNSDGTKLWEYDLNLLFISEKDFGGKTVENAPVLDNSGNVYIGMEALSAGDGSLFENDTLNVAGLKPDGTLRFALHVPDDGELKTYDIYSMASISSNRRLFITVENGFLVAIK